MPTPPGPVRRLWLAMRDQRRELVGAALLGALASACAVALLATSAWLIARASQAPPILTLTVAAVLVRAYALGRSIFRYLERLVGHDAAFRGLTGLRVAVYQRLELLAPVGLARFARGDLLTRLVADVDTALDLPLRVVLPWAQAVLVGVGAVVFLALLLPGAGLVLAILLLLLVAVVPWWSAVLGRRAEARLAPAHGEMAGAVVAALRGAPDLVAFGAAGAALARVHGLDDELTRLSRREGASTGLGAGLGILAQGLAVVVMVVVAVPAVTSGRLAAVWLAVAVLLPLAVADIAATLPTSALALQKVRAAGTRIGEVVDAPLPVAEPARPEQLPAGPYVLELHGLTARWRPDGPPTLRGIDLSLRPGERVAIVGPSGAGKSTLAAVLLRFLDYDGSATLAGAPLRDLDGDSVRGVIGLLDQDAHVFDTTVAENLRLADPAADDDALRRVLDRVGLTGWLAELPEGLRTDVGEYGARMSGGQRQRLALARLLLAERPVLVLDEPTEHLDPDAADALADDLLALTQDRAAVLITHRLTGLERVDQVLVLADGRVAAAGTHAELVAADGWYARRWRAELEQRDLAAVMAAIPAGTAARLPASGG